MKHSKKVRKNKINKILSTEIKLRVEKELN